MAQWGEGQERCRRFRGAIILELVLVFAILMTAGESAQWGRKETVAVAADGYIKWVDFNVTYEALCKAYRYDVDTYGTATAAISGGEFGSGSVETLCSIAEKVLAGETTMEALTADLTYYPYYLEAYHAVLDGYVGTYEYKAQDGTWKTCYGLKAFSPIAKGFEYSDYDDFGVSRSYGYKRQHLGHDMMGQIGTPIIAVESGYVEALGWNQYGGWRIGIRSFDGKRYYYYAHLRQNYPYPEALKEGDVVTAGDVIGYMGHTGYSATENVNNIETVHLHFGIQLIFDESQKEGNNEIWIDCYNLTRFLYKNRSETAKIEGTKEWKRTVEMKDPAVTEYEEKNDGNRSF